MNRQVRFVLRGASACLLAAQTACSVVRADDASDSALSQKALSVLLAKCVTCHGADAQEGNLRLDSREAVLQGGDNGPAIAPGKPRESLLLKAIAHDNAELAMPPKDKLPASEVALLERWIRDGAQWPEKRPAQPSAPALLAGERIGDAWHDPRNPIVQIFGGERLDLWSLRPVSRPDLPTVHNDAWIRNPIDQFILARLNSAALQPSPEADRRALARRLFFDLTGLPPTPTEMEQFLTDPDGDAYERLVDRLLASPRYGEHAARMWLDVIRYSDSNGFDWDEFRPKAWLFRDYVIRSLNSDKPFDQFIREQLAGDELLVGAPGSTAEQDMLIATGYLRLGPQDNAAALFNEQSRARSEWMADLVETTSSAFLGLTMSCCRCHDHKFDPLSHADHFRMRAFFEPLTPADSKPLDLASEQEAIRQHNAALDASAQPIEQARKQLRATVKQRLRSQRTAQLSDEDKNLLSSPPTNPTAEIKAKLDELAKRIEPADEEVKKCFSETEQQQDKELEAALTAINSKRREFHTGLLASDTTGEVPATHVLYQGNHAAEREAVVPGFLSALDPNPAEIEPAPNTSSTGRRLTLANWIASAENPLTSRVLVNRVWQSHFGRGLVATPNDFGLAGERPTHPELLDWLASEFIQQGWSIKRLHRLIVTSAAYRQASTSASVNGQEETRVSLYASQSLRRLTAEQLRDAILSVSRLLNSKTHGPPVWPELPANILQANPAFLDDNKEKTKGWYPSPAEEINARSIFLVQKRTVKIPFLETFDLPDNTVSCAQRNTSTVAPQALSLLNSALTAQASAALAERVRSQAGEGRAAQVRAVFSLALLREPNEEELSSCISFIEERSLLEFCRVALNLNEFIYID